MALELPIDMKDRQFEIVYSCGNPFGEDDEYDGLTLTIEVKSLEEADAIAAAVRANDPSKTDEVTFETARRRRLAQKST